MRPWALIRALKVHVNIFVSWMSLLGEYYLYFDHLCFFCVIIFYLTNRYVYFKKKESCYVWPFSVYLQLKIMIGSSHGFDVKRIQTIWHQCLYTYTAVNLQMMEYRLVYHLVQVGYWNFSRWVFFLEIHSLVRLYLEKFFHLRLVKGCKWLEKGR